MVLLVVGCQLWVLGCQLAVVGFGLSILFVIASALFFIARIYSKLNGYQIISNLKPASRRAGNLLQRLILPASRRDGFDLAESCMELIPRFSSRNDVAGFIVAYEIIPLLCHQKIA